MNVSSRKAVVVIFSVALILGIISASAFAASQTFTGVIGDAMCGAKHVMPGNDRLLHARLHLERLEVRLSSREKVYVLDTADKTLLSQFQAKAGQKVTITGATKDMTITVTSVRAAP
jgi:hypothetical protein